MILLITTGKAVLMVLGTLFLIAIAAIFGALANALSPNIEEEEAKDIPGYDGDYTFTERPFNSYEFYN